jgi:hypothetical protein
MFIRPGGNRVRIGVHKPGQSFDEYLYLRTHVVLMAPIPKYQAGEEEKVRRWDVMTWALFARNLVIRSAEDKEDKITTSGTG